MADLGAMVSTIREETFKSKWPNWKIHPTTKILRYYDGNHSSAMGRVTVKASYQGGEQMILNIYIVENHCLTLFGLADMGKLRMTLDTETRSISVAPGSVNSVEPISNPHSEKLLAE
ncbi:MAG: hypothetical protein GY696_07920 [Gammaproteobacteria bacterium]|nr:hypothetical protein [Gammaproteobacteria bacterium]